MSNTRLQLSLKAQKLSNVAGLLHKSDPFAIVTVLGDDPDNKPVVLGKTEVIQNNLNPSWTKVIILEGYQFGMPLYFEVGVFDFNYKHAQAIRQSSIRETEDPEKALSEQQRKKLPPHRCMGTSLFEVGEVLGSRGNVASKKLKSGGAIYVHMERNKEDGKCGTLKFQIRGLQLANMRSELLNKRSNPFFEIQRRVDRPSGATWNNVYRSRVVRSNLNPYWDPATVDLETFCNGDLERLIRVVVFDHRKTGKHKLMGEFETSVKRFMEAKTQKGNADLGVAFTLRNNKKGKIVLVGRIVVVEAKILASRGITDGSIVEGGEQQLSMPPRPQFIDYLSGGCEISLAVAIDFSASNGDPRQPGTPHHFHPVVSKEWNDYEKAIYAVGSILAKFDADQKFPVWGFGAKYENQIRHCFQCGRQEEVRKVTGLLEAYRGVFKTPLTMSSPAVFTEVIRTAAAYAAHKQKNSQEEGKLAYTILLILTAGDVYNVKETKLELAKASKSPLSVVICGIGDADFSKMEFLDEHDPKQEEGRDITKFVHFKEYRTNNALTQAVLDEIPDQLVDYFYGRGLMPGKAEHVDSDSVRIQPEDEQGDEAGRFFE